MPAAVRTITNILEAPGTGKPLAGRQVSIRLNTPAFINGGTVEKARTTYATTDADGMWSAVLEVNADHDPAGTSYTVAELPGVIWTFVVPAGDSAVPVTLRECLVADPDAPAPVVAGVSAQELADAVAGAGAGTEVATADVLPSSTIRENALTADLLFGYEHIPGGGWRRKDGALVVPQYFSDPADATKLPRALKAFADASAAYTRTRQSSTASATKAGMPPLASGVGPELYFTPDQEWHWTMVEHLNSVGLARKTPAFMLTSALQRLHFDRTSFVWHSTANNRFGIATSYRCYSDAVVRSNGDITDWDGTVTQEHDYYSGGRGTGGRIEWRYRKSAQSIIDQDVRRGDGMAEANAVHVDLLDGVDHAWFTAHSIGSGNQPPARAVGQWVVISCGMNLDDAHERKDWMVTQVIGMKPDGGSWHYNAGYTATGPGYYRLSEPFPVDMTVAQQKWAYDGGTSSKWVYTATGVDNTETHSVYDLDPLLYCQHPHVGDVDFTLAATATSAPASWVSMQSCRDSSTGHMRAFGVGVQVLDHNCAKNASFDIIEVMGTNTGLSGFLNQGMAVDATTSQVRGNEIRSRNYIGAVAQAESFSRVEIQKALLRDVHPNRMDGSLKTTLQDKGALQAFGTSQLFVADCDWWSANGRLTFTAFDGEVKITRRLSITALDSTKRPQITSADIGASCKLRYDGHKLDGSASVLYKTREQLPAVQPVVVPYTKALSTTVLVSAPLPPGLIGKGSQITIPADTTGVKAITLVNQNTGIPAGAQLLQLMNGTTLTDVTGSASVVDPEDPTDAERTVTSAGGGFTSVTIGDRFVWSGGNPDGTSFVATILNIAGAPNSVILDQMLPRNLASGQTVRVGDPITPGTTTELPRFATGIASRLAIAQSFGQGKLEAEAAGGTCYLRVTFDTTADDASGKAILLDLVMHPQDQSSGSAVPITRTRPAVVGDRSRPAVVLASMLAGLRPSLSDQTTDSGLYAPLYAVMKTDSAAKNTDTTLTTSAVLILTLPPSVILKFQGLIFYDCDSAADLKMGWSLIGAGATGKWTPDGLGSGIAAASLSGVVQRNAVDIASTAVAGGANAGTALVATPRGMVQTGTAGATLAFRYAQNTSHASDLVVRALSMIEAVPIST